MSLQFFVLALSQTSSIARAEDGFPLVGPSVARAVCNFPSSRLGPPVKVRLAGTDLEIGEIGDWGGDPRMVATLGEERGAPVLRGAIRGSGMQVIVDLDLRESTPLEPTRDIDRGPALILEHARLRVQGFEGQAVRVSPAVWTDPPTVKPKLPLQVALPCEDLRVARYLPADFEGDMLRAVGAEQAEEAVVHGKARLRDAPGGAIVATLPAKGGPRYVRVLERQGDQARIVITEWEGVVWRGWIAADALRPPEDGGMAGILGALGGLSAGADPVYHRCNAAVPLFVVHDGQPWPLGTLLADSAFELSGQTVGDLATIRLPSGFLSLNEGSSLAVTASVTQCPVTTVARPSSPLDGLLQGELGG